MRKNKTVTRTAIVDFGNPLGTFTPTEFHVQRAKEDVLIKTRPWQEECFKLLSREQYRRVHAPMGAGKSIMAHMLAQSDFETNNQKVLFIVPQTDIGFGFEFSRIKQYKKKEFKIRVIDKYNLVKSKMSTCIDSLNNFLGARRAKNRPLVAVTTHQAFMKLYKKMKKEDRLKDFKNLSIFVDEAHHMVQWKGLENTLGEAVSSVMKNRSNNVTLLTATPFRGDGLPIVSEDSKELFKPYIRAWDKHFDDLEYLKGFNYNLLMYQGNYIKSIQEAFKNDKKGECFKKTLIHIPHRGSNIANDCKYAEVEKIINALQDKGTRKPIGWRESVFFDIIHKGQSIRVVNLVDDSNSRLRGKRKEYIKEHAKGGKIGGPDLIIALNMMKEGSNYEPLERSIIVGEKGSLTDVVQTIGRPLRDHPGQGKNGKKIVDIYHLIPFCFEGYGKEDFNNYLKAIACGMLVLDVMLPNLTPTERSNRESSGERQPSLYEQYGLSIDDWQCIIEESWQWYVRNTNRWSWNEKLKLQFEEEFAEWFEEFGLSNDEAQNLVRYLLRVIARKNFAFDGRTNVAEIDIDLIDNIKNPFGFLKVEAKQFGLKTFKAVRKTFETSNEERARKQCIEVCEWIFKNGGRYPIRNTSDPIENDYAIWVGQKINAKSGSGQVLWYPSLDTIISSYGYDDLFDLKVGALAAQKKMYEMCDWIKSKNNGLYPTRSNGKKYKTFIANVRLGNKIYRYGLDAIAIEYGYNDIFERFVPKEYNIEKLKSVCKWIDINGRYPKMKDKDSEEYKHASFICRLISSKNRKNNNIKPGYRCGDFYDEYIKVIENYGYGDLLDTKEEKSEKKTIELCEWIKSNNGLYPSQSSEKGSIEYQMVTFLRRARNAKRKNLSHWYDHYDRVAKEYGYDDLFDTNCRESLVLEKLEDVCKWMKKNGDVKPKQNSKIKEEYKHARWLQRLIKAKHGKNEYRWIRKYDEIAKNYGYDDLFYDHRDRQIRKCIEIFKWIIFNKRIPKAKLSGNEKYYEGWIRKRRDSIRGMNKTLFYSEYHDIANIFGLDNIFNSDFVFDINSLKKPTKQEIEAIIG